MRLLIQNAGIFTGGAVSRADLLLCGGAVERVAPRIDAAADERIDGEGCVLAPAFTDLHVHLRQPGFEYKETVATGTAAAAAGGFGTVCAMPNLSPVPDSAENLRPQLRAIESGAAVRVLPYGALTAGERGEALADIAALAPLVVGFSDDGRGVQREDVMRAAMAEVAKTGLFAAVHCEDEALLPRGGVCVQAGCDFALRHGFEGYPSESEWRQARRDIALAEQTGCRLHICHASAAETFELVRGAQKRGLAVSCEVTPHNLLLACDDISEDDGRFKMNPPLRTKRDVAAARRALADGTACAVATDHAPHAPREKEGGFAAAANGVVGLETAFSALYTALVQGGELSLETLLSRFTYGPAALTGEEPFGFEEGRPASFVLIDLGRRWRADPRRFKSMGRATPFAGASLRGRVRLTFHGGRRVYGGDWGYALNGGNHP